MNGNQRASVKNLGGSSEIPVLLRRRKAVISKQTKNEEVAKRAGIFAAGNYQLSPSYAEACVAPLPGTPFLPLLCLADSHSPPDAAQLVASA